MLVHPEVAPLADRRELSLEPCRFRTGFGGLFLFIPFLAQLPLEQLFGRLPGSTKIPAPCCRCWRSSSTASGARSCLRCSTADSLCSPASTPSPSGSTLTEYTCRVDPRDIPASDWQRGPWASPAATDFHTIPYHGDRALKHYVSKRSRRQKGILAFLARDADARVFCYANAKVRKENQNHEILRFVEYWKERHGDFPKELVSRLTTQAVLGQLDAMGIRFLTLRRRSAVQALNAASGWKQVRLSNVGRPESSRPTHHHE